LITLISSAQSSVTQAYFELRELELHQVAELATLGYGDISPINIVARDLAVLEAIMGQLYLVILISRLVNEGGEKSAMRQDG